MDIKYVRKKSYTEEEKRCLAVKLQEMECSDESRDAFEQALEDGTIASYADEDGVKQARR